MHIATVRRRFISIELLVAFADAWTRHDANAIISMMTSDCIFETSRGPEVTGTVYSDQDEVRRGVEDVFATFPDARRNEPKHFIAGDRGVSQWVFTATIPNGARVEVQGCDVFTFRHGKERTRSRHSPRSA